MNKSDILRLSAIAAAALLAGQSAKANFLVAEFGVNGTCEKYSGSGVYLCNFTNGLSGPLGVAEGGGNIYLNELGGGAGSGGQTTKFSPAGANLGVVNSAATYNGHGPAGLAYNNGRLCSAAYTLNYLVSSGPDVGTEDGDPNTPLTYLYHTPAPDAAVHGVASAAPNGFSDIFYYTTTAGDGSGTLGYWQPGGAAGSIINFAAGSSPRGVVANAGNTYIALLDSGKIVKRDGSGVVTDWLTGLTSPVGVAIDSGILYVGSFNGKTIAGYSLATGALLFQFSTLGSPQYFVVNGLDTATTVTSSLNPSQYGDRVTFTATVSPADATGTVLFKEGGATLGTATLSGGTATFSTVSLLGGVHSVTAVYAGDASYKASLSSVLSQTVKATANFLVAESSSGTAEIYNRTGKHLISFASGLSVPVGVAVGGENVYISEYAGGVNKYATDGAALGVVNANSGPYGHGPAGLAYINGRIHTATYNAGYLVSSGPDVGTEDGDPATPLAYLWYQPFPGGTVHGLASGATNGFTDVVYYTGQNAAGNALLSWWQPGAAAGDIYDFGVVGAVRGVVAAGNSTLYVALYDQGKVMKVSHSGGWTATDFITCNTPVGLAIDGDVLYVSSFGDKTITGYNLATGAQVSQFPTLDSPQYFAIVPFGKAPPPSGTVILFY